MKKIIPFISLIVILSCFNSPKTHWNDASDLQGTWITLERDSIGYLIYEPCDKGYSSSITVNETKIIYKIGYEGLDTLQIDAVKILNSSNEIEVSAYNDYYSINSLLKIIDADENLYLWKWELRPKIEPKAIRKGKRMMTRQEFRNEFRYIKNPCDSGRVSEKQFLPIEYE